MFGNVKILLAEDDANDRLFFEIAFSRSAPDGSVFIAKDGAEALNYLKGEAPFNDRAKHRSPDMLLLDLRMPRLDGFAVLAWLLWNPGLRPPWVGVFSASEDPEDRRRAQLLGADAYLVKPQDPGKLGFVIKGLVQQYFEIVTAGASPQRNTMDYTPRPDASLHPVMGDSVPGRGCP